MSNETELKRMLCYQMGPVDFLELLEQVAKERAIEFVQLKDEFRSKQWFRLAGQFRVLSKDRIINEM